MQYTFFAVCIESQSSKAPRPQAFPPWTPCSRISMPNLRLVQTFSATVEVRSIRSEFVCLRGCGSDSSVRGLCRRVRSRGPGGMVVFCAGGGCATNSTFLDTSHTITQISQVPSHSTPQTRPPQSNFSDHRDDRPAYLLPRRSPVYCSHP